MIFINLDYLLFMVDDPSFELSADKQVNESKELEKLTNASKHGKLTVSVVCNV